MIPALPKSVSYTHLVFDLEALPHHGFTQVSVYQHSRKPGLSQHLPQVGRYRAFALIWQTACQQDLSCILATEFNIDTQTVHCLFYCAGRR